MDQGKGAVGVAAVLLSPILLVFGIMGMGASSGTDACTTEVNTAAVTVDPSLVPAGDIEGYSGEQLTNAAWIIQAGTDMGLSLRDQTIGIMAAMGESGLRVLDHGDTAGPDSCGLFQQRDNGAWGSYEDRMNPYISATNFFKVLVTIDDRDTMTPTAVAHQVQRNADPEHYTTWWDAAQAVVSGLSGTRMAAARAVQCSAAGAQPGMVSANGWALPDNGPITSPFGYRIHPITGSRTFHYGVDLAGGCGTPIFAVHEGRVVDVGTDAGGNNYIKIDHGGGISTRYLHEWEDGIFVAEGDHVTAGQQIAEEGSSGQSIGCHLHFETLINGKNVDPQKFMAQYGIELG